MPQIVVAPASAVLLVVAVAAFVAYWLIWAGKDAISLKGALVKTASTGALAFVGVLGQAPAYACVGLALGALGDFFLARRGERAFLAGMAAFALGHLAYALGMVRFGAGFGPLLGSAAQQIAVLALGLLLVSTEVWLAPRTAALRWPVRGYVLVIGLMGLAAIALPAHPETLAAAVIRLGAGLFILSDLLLALRLFVLLKGPGARALSLALWPAYWAGQALILVGAALYAQPFGA